MSSLQKLSWLPLVAVAVIGIALIVPDVIRTATANTPDLSATERPSRNVALTESELIDGQDWEVMARKGSRRSP